MGDFNIDLLKNWSSDYTNLVFAKNVFPTITEATRVSDVSASLIYNIFTNTNSSLISGVLISDTSDHFPVF